MDKSINDKTLRVLAYYEFPIVFLQTNWSIIEYFEENEVLYISTSIMLFENDKPSYSLTIVQNNNVIFQQGPYSSSQAAYIAAIEFIIDNLDTILNEHKNKQMV